jgi:hypothetical protein
MDDDLRKKLWDAVDRMDMGYYLFGESQDEYSYKMMFVSSRSNNFTITIEKGKDDEKESQES